MLPVAPPSPDYVPGPEEPHTPPASQDEDEHEPMFIQPHDPDFVPKPIYPKYIPLEDEHILPAEEQPLPPIISPTAESPGDDADDEDEDEKDDEEEVKEDHLALANSDAAISLPPEAEVERLLAMPTPSPSPLSSLSPPSVGEGLARCMTPAALPSPPLPPPLHMPPHITIGVISPRLRCHLARGIGEVGYGIRDTWVGLAETVPEIAHMNVEEASGIDGKDSPGDGRHETRDGRHAGRVVSTTWNSQIRSLGPNAYSMTWEVLKKKMTDKYCPQGEIKKLEIELWNLKVKENNVSAYTERFQELTLICTKFVADETEKIDKYVSGLPDNIYESVKASKSKMLDETIELANDLMDQKLRNYAERQSNNKRNANESFRNNHGHQQYAPKRSSGNANVTYVQRNNGANPKGNEKRGNASRDTDSNVVTGTFLLNNRYTSILFDTGADRSFISTVFSSLIDIVPTLLGNSYDVELADGKIVRVDTIMRGCTLNFLGHPFNIDLMHVELGSFDVIIGMDWLRICHVVIVCDEKLVRIPYGIETLTFRGNESNNRRESRLTVISCSKAQEYMAKGCQVFLAQISAKKEEDKSEGKQLEDVPVVQDYPEVFPKDLASLPLARPVEFQIDLIPRAAL
uniref:Reverse transcriptase domain-containing protein n=1 Tax=Tanacetum cinerariifolium TaxID=118510 RepID=A0A6L2NV21_TANCI|nr:reverse transcriptase domain-containing protein [Tanacetum cinerariifolium]